MPTVQHDPAWALCNVLYLEVDGCICSVRITKQPKFLRHFTCGCEWV